MVRKGALDLEAFVAALERARTTRKVPWRQVARESGVQPSTLTRMVRQRKRPDVDTFASLVLWLGGGADGFLCRKAP